MNETESLFTAIRRELPVCGRHRDVSHLDCVECMYLSTKLYAPLEQIEQATDAAWKVVGANYDTSEEGITGKQPLWVGLADLEGALRDLGYVD
jgi:hypothetical protein